MRFILLLLTAILLVSSCSGRTKQNLVNLETTISDDGSKRFIYYIDLRNREARFSNLESGQPRRQRGLLPESIRRIEKRLKRQIKRNGFCTTGYFIFDRRYSNGYFEIHGECNEAQ